MPIDLATLTAEDVQRILAHNEGHFLDYKSTAIAPAKLSKTIAALANADGGEVFIGVEDAKNTPTGVPEWRGFQSEEDANAHLQVFEELFPLGQDFRYQFLAAAGESGLLLHVQVLKTRDIKYAKDGRPYVRRGAQNLPITTDEALNNLRRAKGLVSHEDATVAADHAAISNSLKIVEFMLDVVPNQQPEPWLKKQLLIIEEKPTVAGCMLFADEPQVYLPKASIKIYRYRTADLEGTRATLAFDPISIDGPVYDQVRTAVQRTVELTEEIRISTDEGLKPIRYPREALHEVITNAVLHRDYAFNDDVHVRIMRDLRRVPGQARQPHFTRPGRLDAHRFRPRAEGRVAFGWDRLPRRGEGE